MTRRPIAQVGAYMQFDREQYEQQGQGLGLTIAKRLAELHGGELTIESVAALNHGGAGDVAIVEMHVRRQRPARWCS